MHHEYEVDVFNQVTVGRVMDRGPAIVPATATLAHLAERLARGEAALVRHQALLPADAQGALVGVLTRGDLLRGSERDPSGALTAEEAGASRLQVAYPDETLNEALSRMLHHQCGRLPVVERSEATKIVGYLGRTAVFEARLRRLQEDHVREPGWIKRALRTNPV